MTNRIYPEVQLAFDLTLKLGGADPREMSDSNKALVWGEIARSPKLRNLALLHLVAESNRAELTKERLIAEIRAVFSI
jgi:hypothetical protein